MSRLAHSMFLLCLSALTALPAEAANKRPVGTSRNRLPVCTRRQKAFTKKACALESSTPQAPRQTLGCCKWMLAAGSSAVSAALTSPPPMSFAAPWVEFFGRCAAKPPCLVCGQASTSGRYRRRRAATMVASRCAVQRAAWWPCRASLALVTNSASMHARGRRQREAAWVTTAMRLSFAAWQVGRPGMVRPGCCHPMEPRACQTRGYLRSLSTVHGNRCVGSPRAPPLWLANPWAFRARLVARRRRCPPGPLPHPPAWGMCAALGAREAFWNAASSVATM